MNSDSTLSKFKSTAIIITFFHLAGCNPPSNFSTDSSAKMIPGTNPQQYQIAVRITQGNKVVFTPTIMVLAGKEGTIEIDGGRSSMKCSVVVTETDGVPIASITISVIEKGMVVLNGTQQMHIGNLAEVAVDEMGTRVLSKLPPVGVHPRVLFTAEDYPDIRQRLQHTKFGKIVQKHVSGIATKVKKDFAAFNELDLAEPSLEAVEKYFRNDEMRNINWGVTSIDAVLRDDTQTKQFMAKVITNYARLILASKSMSAGEVKGKTGDLNKRFNVWKSDSFDLSVCWIFGGAGMALSYDVLFNDMTDEQRNLVRKALATATRGRRSYGMDEPRGKAISNHYGYHGDLALMLAAIEGEEGFDEATYKRIEQVLVDFFEIGFTPGGACHEDMYGPAVGLREGSRGMLVLARRGKNLFRTERYKNFVRYFSNEIEPFPDGVFIGGASGGPGMPYPTSVLFAKYLRPKDPVTDYNWRWLMGDDYKRQFKWQSMIGLFLFGMDYESPADQPNTLELTPLPLTTFYPRRGKLITRSDWSQDAVVFHFDARPDAFSIGHDTVDRGTFVLSALGRPWAVHPAWNYFRKSSDYNLVHIDGKAQEWKAPSVKFLSHDDSGEVVIAAADLKYAYDWQWSPPWPNKEKKFDPPWEPEMSDPRDLGWPDDPEWLPHKLFDEPGIGYIGSYMWRRPFNKVQKAFRTALFVRGKHPYAIIVDDIRKDDAQHKYEWFMQVAEDLEVKSESGRDIILGAKDAAGEKASRLLVRVLEAFGPDGKTPDTIKAIFENYEANKDRRGKPIMGTRLILSIDSIEPAFKILLFPFWEGDALPETAWTEEGEQLRLTMGAREQMTRFEMDESGRTIVSFTQD